MKVCINCEAAKPLDAFGVNRRYEDGRDRRCRTCVRAKSRANYTAENSQRTARWRERNPESALRADRKARAKKYGLTLEDYEALLAVRGNVCWCCGTDTPGHGRTYMAIDHDHATGQVRGLLCFDCNTGLGRFRDDVNVMAAAIAYLEGQ